MIEAAEGGTRARVNRRTRKSDAAETSRVAAGTTIEKEEKEEDEVEAEEVEGPHGGHGVGGATRGDKYTTGSTTASASDTVSTDSG